MIAVFVFLQMFALLLNYLVDLAGEGNYKILPLLLNTDIHEFTSLAKNQK